MRKLVTLSVVLLITIFGWAQSKTITGQVKDESGKPMVGVSVLAKGTQIGATTDEGGKFSLSVPSNTRTIVFSSVGFALQEVSISGKESVNVTLQTEESSLSEVVVTGLGTATAKKKVAISVESISGKDLPPVPAGSIDRALVGRVAGATIQSTSGQPGQQASILLRGINTLGSTQPLIMVDGVQINAGGNFNGSGTNTSSRLSDLDLNNVERIEIVQGAAAGTLYGAQGANGVIQIFTKKGLKGKPRITLNHSSNFDEAIMGDLSLAKNHYFSTNQEGFITNSSGARLQPSTFGVWPAPVGTISGTTKNDKQYKEDVFDNVSEIFRNAYTMNNGLNIAGGTPGVDYNFNLTNLRQESIIFGENERTNLSLNLGLDIAKGLTARITSQVIFGSNNTGGITGQNNVNSALGTALNTRPFINLKNINNFGNLVANPAGDNSVNPHFNFRYRTYDAKTTRQVNSANLNYKPIKYLELDFKYGIDNTRYDFEDFIANQNAVLPVAPQPGSSGINPIDGRITRLLDRETLQNALTSAFIRFNFADDFKMNIPLTSSTQVSYDWRKNVFFRNRLQGTGLPTFPPQNMTSTAQKDASDFEQEFVTFGYLVNQRFDWGSLFGVSGGFRADYASTFGEAKNPFFFPRGDAYFNVAELLDNSTIRLLKVRAAYGEAGIQPGAYSRQVTLSSANVGQAGTLFVPTLAPNPALKVERSKEFEIGTDIGFRPKLFNGEFLSRIDLNVTYWTRKGEDVIRQIDLPLSAGIATLLTNAISLESDGWQATLNLGVVDKPNFKYDLGINFGKQQTMVTKISNGKDIVIGGSGSGQFVLKEGVPVGAFYGRRPVRALDELDSQGKPIIPEANRGNFEVVNGMVVNKTSKAVSHTNEQEFLGDPTPKFNMSFLNTFRLMDRLTIFAQLDWFQGNKIYNQTRQWLYRDQIHSDFDIPVTINGETAPWVNYYNSLYLTNNNNGYFVENGSFLRLRDVTLSYNLMLSTSVMKTLKTATVFISGRNLATITNYTGMDPEAAAAFNNPLNRGLDLYAFPNARSFQAGFTLGF